MAPAARSTIGRGPTVSLSSSLSPPWAEFGSFLFILGETTHWALLSDPAPLAVLSPPLAAAFTAALLPALLGTTQQRSAARLATGALWLASAVPAARLLDERRALYSAAAAVVYVSALRAVEWAAVRVASDAYGGGEYYAGGDERRGAARELVRVWRRLVLRLAKIAAVAAPELPADSPHRKRGGCVDGSGGEGGRDAGAAAPRPPAPCETDRDAGAAAAGGGAAGAAPPRARDPSTAAAKAKGEISEFSDPTGTRAPPNQPTRPQCAPAPARARPPQGAARVPSCTALCSSDTCLASFCCASLVSASIPCRVHRIQDYADGSADVRLSWSPGRGIFAAEFQIFIEARRDAPSLARPLLLSALFSLLSFVELSKSHSFAHVIPHAPT